MAKTTVKTEGDLTPFEGKPVTAVGLEIPGAAGGLRDALEVEPIELHHGGDCVLVLDLSVVKVRFDPANKKDPEQGLRRVHVTSVEGATFIDREVVQAALDAMKSKIEARKEQEAGVRRLTGTAPDIEQHYEDGLDDFDPDRPDADDDLGGEGDG